MLVFQHDQSSNAMLHGMIPDRAVCAAVDVSPASAEGSPVQCRQRQLQQVRLWLSWLMHVQFKGEVSLSAAGCLVEGWSTRYRCHPVKGSSLRQWCRRLYAVRWPHRSLLLSNCGLVQRVQHCTGWYSQSGSTEANLAGREEGPGKEEVGLRGWPCLQSERLTRNKQTKKQNCKKET